MNIAYNMDCMEAMRKIPDKWFDLAVCDPLAENVCKETGVDYYIKDSLRKEMEK